MIKCHEDCKLTKKVANLIEELRLYRLEFWFGVNAIALIESEPHFRHGYYPRIILSGATQ